MSDALTQKDSMSRLMVEPVQAFRLFGSEVRRCFLRRDGDRKKVGKHVNPRWQEKPLVLIPKAPVPQTDAGGRGENPKTNERTLVKELGKMTP